MYSSIWPPHSFLGYISTVLEYSNQSSSPWQLATQYLSWFSCSNDSNDMISGEGEHIGLKAMPMDLDLEKLMVSQDSSLPRMEVNAYKHVRWSLGRHGQIHHGSDGAGKSMF
jgi:hypothetical protein